MPFFSSPGVQDHPSRANAAESHSFEEIASDLRRSAAWFALPLAAASVARVALERHYWGATYLAWLFVILAYAALQWTILRRPGPRAIRLSLLTNFVGVGVGYSMIGAALDSANGWRADDALWRIERALFRCDPQQFLAPWRSPWLSTFAILGYVSFVGFLIYLFLAESFKLSRNTGLLQVGLMGLYGVGYSSYILFPAAGPVFHQRFLMDPSVQTSVSAYLNSWVIRCCSGVDAWPSLHAAVCCFALFWTHRLHRPVFYVLIVPSAALMLGSVYFEFHYFVDMLAGCVLGAVCFLALCRVGRDPRRPDAARPQ